MIIIKLGNLVKITEELNLNYSLTEARKYYSKKSFNSRMYHVFGLGLANKELESHGCPRNYWKDFGNKVEKFA